MGPAGKGNPAATLVLTMADGSDGWSMTAEIHLMQGAACTQGSHAKAQSDLSPGDLETGARESARLFFFFLVAPQEGFCQPCMSVFLS